MQQRRHRKRLRAGEIALLAKLAFRSAPREDDWETRFQRLQQLRAWFGRIQGPVDWTEDPKR